MIDRNRVVSLRILAVFIMFEVSAYAISREVGRRIDHHRAEWALARQAEAEAKRAREAARPEPKTKEQLAREYEAKRLADEELVWFKKTAYAIHSRKRNGDWTAADEARVPAKFRGTKFAAYPGIEGPPQAGSKP